MPSPVARPLAALVLAALVVGACDLPAALLPASPGASVAPGAAASDGPGAASSAAAPSREPAADTASLKGKGNKTGKPVALEGDYVLKTSVKLKRGCIFRVYLDGWNSETLDAAKNRSGGGRHKATVDLVGLPRQPYRIRVKAKKCGAWSAALTRP